MIGLTTKEQEALLIIYKDFTSFYNANSLSKTLQITQVGAMKLLKRLESQKFLKGSKIGKSIIYKINLEEELTQKLLAFALVNESGKYERWKDEFKLLNKKGRILLFYGSAARNYAQSKDIDLMIILEKKDMQEVNKNLKRIQETLPKKVHAIQATKGDLVNNFKKKDKVIIEIIKTSIVLEGYDKYMEIINGFAGF